MRLFIAVNFNNDTRAKLIAKQDELRMRSKRGNFCAPQMLHLTLAFLGECDVKQREAAKAAMEALNFDPFSISIDRIGRFKRGGGDIWWAGLQESKPLAKLQQDLTDNLVARGFALERRKFSPHVTLGREVVTDLKPWEAESFGETVSVIDLMKSERIQGKLLYSSIFRRGKWLNPIAVLPYNPKWAQEFKRICDHITACLGDLAVAIHHVGSTSVVGLSAKPIIDVDVEIASYDTFRQVCDKLNDAGWRHEGNYGIEGREAFKPLRPLGLMEHNLYVCHSDSNELRRHLAFRDYLRGNKTAADEYGSLKQRLAKQHGNDIDAYIDGKTALIERILECVQTR